MHHCINQQRYALHKTKEKKEFGCLPVRSTQTGGYAALRFLGTFFHP
jgi:hypothetical protein